MGDARIVLTTLIDEKLLAPGPKKLYVSYYRKRVYADLLPDGSIRFKDQVYTSPVPCALHMKRTLNPSLKTDAGWSSMYSAASGESLKDIKDRLNIRKRGTNARSAHKEKKAPAPSPTAKEKMVQAAAAQAKEAAPKCAACRKEATTDVAECSACHCKTHFKCVSPALQAPPPAPWFCEKCLTGQANRILEFLQQTRRVLVERIAEQKEKEKPAEIVSEDVTMENEEEASTEDKAEEETSPDDKAEEEAPTEDKAEEETADAEEEKEVVDVETPTAESEEKSDESTSDSAAVTVDISNEPKDVADNETTAAVTVDDSTPADEESKNDTSTSIDALKEKEIKQEAIDAIIADDDAEGAKSSEEAVEYESAEDDAQLVLSKTTQTLSAEEKFLVLVDSLIAEVSSKTDRVNLIANSTGATLVHLEKTQLVQLVEYGKREILAATQPESEDDEEQDDDTEADHAGSHNSEVGALIKIFDLRHQILSSQSQFERTTNTLAKRTEGRLRDAENELMELEESRVVEARTITKVVDLISQYSSDLTKCEQKIHYNEVLLESINHRRNFIRSSNINDRFVPSYRYSTKLMTTSSDQLLLTVLLDKLRDITESVNEWTKMERHFEKMTSSLNKSLSLIGTKRKRTAAPVKLPPTPALFAKVKIPPSRRLIERQIANYEVNLNAIRQNRAHMRKTLYGILKITQEEHLSEEIVNMIDMLYQKCRDLKAEEEEKQLRIKKEAEEAEAQAKEEEERAARELQSTDDGEASAEEPEAKKQRMDKTNSVPDSNSGVNSHKAAPSSDLKGISSLLGSEDSDAKESNYSSAESKSRAENDEDSDGDLEQASRAIADITSSVLPDIPVGSDSLLNSPPMSAKPATEASPGQFMIRGGKGVSDKRDQHRGQDSKPSGQAGQDQQSFLDQALEVLNKQQQQQQHLEQERIEQQRQLEKQQKQLERQQQQLEQQRQSEQRQLEQQRQERERLDRERQERERVEKQQRLERQRIEKQRQEQERWEQQRLEQERREQQRIEQARIEEQRRVEEQRRLEQQRLEQQKRLEQQQKQRLEQQRLEQQRLEKQRQEQQRLEQQRQEQQRLEQQRKEKQRQEQQRRQQEQQQRLELQRRQQEQQRQEQQRQFQHSKPSSLPQVAPPGSSHLQLLNQQQQQQLQQQQAALQQQQHSRQIQHPLYGDMPKGMLGMGTSQQDIYGQQAAQMGMDMHDVVRHQDSGHFVGNAPGGLRGAPYEVSRSAEPGPTAPRTSFYSDDGQMHSQDVFGSQGLPGQQRQLPDHHMFTNELQQQQQQPGQSRPMGTQDFLMGRQQYRSLNGNNMQHGLDQSDDNDVNMGDWGQ